MEAPGPCLELAAGVVAAAPARAEVEAHVAPRRRRAVRLKGALGVVAEDERDAMRAQQLVDLVHEPAAVAKLERVPALREARESLRQALVVALERLGQLPQNWPEPSALRQRLDALIEASRARPCVGEPFDMRQIAAGLHGEDEARRSLGDPVLHGGARDQPVEGGVDLDRVKARRVVLEPAPGGQSVRIQLAAPGAVVPSRAADVNRVHAPALGAAVGGGARRAVSLGCARAHGCPVPAGAVSSSSCWGGG